MSREHLTKKKQRCTNFRFPCASKLPTFFQSKLSSISETFSGPIQFSILHFFMFCCVLFSKNNSHSPLSQTGSCSFQYGCFLAFLEYCYRILLHQLLIFSIVIGETFLEYCHGCFSSSHIAGIYLRLRIDVAVGFQR